MGNIVDERVDCIVNAANSELSGGGGVDGAIHCIAGWNELNDECEKIGHCDVGQAVITPPCNMEGQIKAIIHTVGPFCSSQSRWNEKPSKSEMLSLYNCYFNSLKLANEHSFKTISFPSIATGIFGFPLTYAPDVFKDAINMFEKYVDTTIEEINMVCFDKETYQAYYKYFEK